MHADITEVAPGVHHVRAEHVSWVLVTDGDGVTVVDTGYPGDRERLLHSLERIGRSTKDLDAVVLTHGHPDHMGSAEYLRATHSVPVWVHRDEVPNAHGHRVEQVTLPEVLRRVWRPAVLRWAGDISRLKAMQVERLTASETYDEGTLDVPGQPVVVHAPGHTSGHCVVHLPDRGVLLAGDALMTGHAVTGSTGPRLLPHYFNTDHGQARRSLERLRTLAADVLVPAHGGPFHGSPAHAVRLALEAG